MAVVEARPAAAVALRGHHLQASRVPGKKLSGRNHDSVAASGAMPA